MFVQLTPSPAIYRGDADAASAPPPDTLSAAQGHLAACETEERELARLRGLLDGIARHPRLSGPEVAAAYGWADNAAERLGAAREAIQSSRFEDMPAHVATIRSRMNELREFLIRNGALDRGSPAAQASATPWPHDVTTPDNMARSVPPARRPSRVAPAQFLGVKHAFSGLMRAVKSVGGRVQQHFSGERVQHKSCDALAKLARQDVALKPLREELAQLDHDLTLADMRRDLLMHTPALAGRKAWARHTLGALLGEAQSAASKGRQALTGSRHPQETVESAIATVRSKLSVFNAALEGSDLSGVNFRFLNRPWPTPST